MSSVEQSAMDAAFETEELQLPDVADGAEREETEDGRPSWTPDDGDFS